MAVQLEKYYDKLIQEYNKERRERKEKSLSNSDIKEQKKPSIDTQEEGVPEKQMKDMSGGTQHFLEA